MRTANSWIEVVLAFPLLSVLVNGANSQAGVSRMLVGDRWIHQVTAGETWHTIAARVGIDPDVLATLNGLPVDVALEPGDVLGIDNRHVAPPHGVDGIVVNVPQRMLFHYAGGTVRAAYPVAAGHPDSPTPLGPFSIAEMGTSYLADVPSTQDARRRAEAALVVPFVSRPAPELSTRSLRLSRHRLLIHGTTDATSIYRLSSDGGLQLHAEDVQDLFRYVGPGERVEIVYQPVLLAFDGKTLYLEVHQDTYGRAPKPRAVVADLLEQVGLIHQVDISEIARIAREAKGVAVPVAINSQGRADRIYPRHAKCVHVADSMTGTPHDIVRSACAITESQRGNDSAVDAVDSYLDSASEDRQRTSLRLIAANLAGQPVSADLDG